MKNLITIINLSIIIGITTIFTQSDKTMLNGSSTPADKEALGFQVKVSEPSSKKSLVNEAAEEFLQGMTEARLMDLEEGKIAQQRGTTRSLKDYGALMIKEQSEMLNELKKIAEYKNVTIPAWLGPEKAEGLDDLKKVHGESFDKKFIKMMIIDHKRDIKKLKKAIYHKDADIQVFATKYLPTVQSHLDQIMALKN